MASKNSGTTVFVIPEAKFGKAGAARLTNDGTLVFAVEGVQGEFDGDELIALDCPNPQETLIVGLRWIAELQTNPHYIIGNPAMYELLKDSVLIEDAPELGFGKTRLTQRGENAVEAYHVYQEQNPPKPPANNWQNWQQRFHDEYRRVSEDYEARIGEDMPLSFDEWMDEQTDFAGKRESAQNTFKAQRKLLTDIGTSAVGIEIIANRGGSLKVIEEQAHSILVKLGYYEKAPKPAE
jgi:hypothetical protein